jgi:hypothetical protein
MKTGCRINTVPLNLKPTSIIHPSVVGDQQSAFRRPFDQTNLTSTDRSCSAQALRLDRSKLRTCWPAQLAGFLPRKASFEQCSASFGPQLLAN